MHVRHWLLGAAVILCTAACETGTAPDEEGVVRDTTAAGVEEARAYPYEVVLYGVFTDTLRGDAAFGRVLERERGTEQLVIQLAAAGGFAGGLYITRRDTVMPEVGTHRLADASQPDSVTPAGAYVILLREGLSRQLASTGGQITFRVVSDTLIAGSFDAALRGMTAGVGGLTSEREVRARGTFRAEPASIGYIIGL